MFNDLLTANETYARAQTLAGLPREPAKRLLILTCMDARIDPLAVLGLTLGDAHVLRNAGGRVSDDVIRSILVSTRLLGVRAVVVMHHTACGMASISDMDVESLLGHVDEKHRESFELLAIDDENGALASDVASIAESPLLPPVDVAGLVYDVTTGLVRRVV